jgi:catechol 2,3-dioxygenase-like lactoylglutathione lyase family enzyme
MRMSVSLDCPSLEAGIAFYGAVFGFQVTSRPYTGLAGLAAGDQRLLLIERTENTLPYPNSSHGRSYARHWTPIHLDFHVTDVESVRDRALAAGAKLEAWHERPGKPGVAFMSDPFGHGFCLIGETA